MNKQQAIQIIAIALQELSAKPREHKQINEALQFVNELEEKIKEKK